MPRKRPPKTGQVRQKSLLSRHFLEKQASLLHPPAALMLPATTGIAELLRLVSTHETRSALIEGEPGQIVGIVTERDLALKCMANPAIADAEACMTRGPQTTPSYASVARVLYNMAVGGFRHVPVLSKDPAPPRMLAVTSLVDHIYKDLVRPLWQQRGQGSTVENPLVAFLEQTVSVLGPGPAVLVPTGTTLRSAADIMRDKRIGSVLVGSAREIAGICTEHDLVKALAETPRAAADLHVDAWMTKDPRTILHSSTIGLAFALFSEGRYRHLPVMNDLEQVIGVVSVKSFVAALTRDILKELESR